MKLFGEVILVKCKLCYEKLDYKSYKIKKGHICKRCYDMQPSCIRNSIRTITNKQIFHINKVVHTATPKNWFKYGEFRLSEKSVRVNDWEIEIKDIESIKLDCQPLYPSMLAANLVHGNIILVIETKVPHIIIRETIITKDIMYSISGKNIYYNYGKDLQMVISQLQRNINNQIYNAKKVFEYFQQHDEEEKKERERREKQREYEERAKNSRQSDDRDNTNKNHSSKSKGDLDAAMKIFGMTVPFTIEELKKKRKQLAIKYHPDQGGSVEMCAKINAAFDILKDHVAA